ncbi:MAG: cadherin repeat domain-containing protein, partial [Verrucomicrobiota bacterium]
RASYTVTVRVTDDGVPALSHEQQFTLLVSDANDAPTGLALSNDTIAENAGADAVVGSLSASDADLPAQTLTFSLPEGLGDNAAFNIVGTSLRANGSFDFERRASYTVTVRVTDDGVPALNHEEQFTILVSDANEAPVLADTVVTLGAVNEDAGAPVGAAGTLVSAIADLTGGGGQNNISDVDVGAVAGVAVEAADTANGSWHYTTHGGTVWNALGSVSGTSARLLAADANTRLYFQPNADFNGMVTHGLTFRAWDQTSGVNGGFADTGSNGGSTAFSVFVDTASITVIANDAPVLADANVVLNTVNEDAPAPVGSVGTAVTNLVGFVSSEGTLTNVTDVDGGALLGIAVTAVDTANGSWFYTTNNGIMWSGLSEVGTAHALLLAGSGDSRVYFQPSPNFNGTLTNGLTFRAWDQTSGVNGGFADTTSNGGTNAFSAFVDTASIT